MGTIITPVDRESTRVDPGQVHTPRNTWVVIDATDSGETVGNLGVTERTYQTVLAAIATGTNNDDEISIYDIPRSWNAARFRCIGKTDGGVITYQVWLGTLGDGNRHTDSTTADCELAYAGQLAFVIGQQASTTTDYELADTVTVTASDWPATWTSKTPTGNRVAEATIDLMGADVMVVLASAINCDAKLLGKGY